MNNQSDLFQDQGKPKFKEDFSTKSIDTLNKREEFSVNLRKQKKQQILGERRQKLYLNYRIQNNIKEVVTIGDVETLQKYLDGLLAMTDIDQLI